MQVRASNLYSRHVIMVNCKDQTVRHVPDGLAMKLVPLLENSMITCMEAIVKGEPKGRP